MHLCILNALLKSFFENGLLVVFVVDKDYSPE